MQSLHYLILISEVDETEIFKICLEYWNTLAADLYRENPYPSTSPLQLVRPAHTGDSPFRRQLYNPVLSKVRRVMISRMAKPEEVLVVENEQGEVVREFMKDTDSINMYKNMRETLGTFQRSSKRQNSCSTSLVWNFYCARFLTQSLAVLSLQCI